MSNTKQAKPKRLLSLFLALVMVLGLLPAMSVTASAYTAGDIEGTTGTGTAEDPVVCDTFAEFKAAMENTEIICVKLNGVSGSNGDMPSQASLAAAISNTTYKVLTIEGTNTFTSPLNGMNDCLIWPRNDLTINGTGTLKYVHGNTGGTGAVINMASDNLLAINGNVTLEGGANGTSFGYAIFAQAGTTKINGGSFIGYNAFIANNADMSAVTISRSANLTINGGNFSASLHPSSPEGKKAHSLSITSTSTGTISIKEGTFSQGINIDATGKTIETCGYFNEAKEISVNGSVIAAFESTEALRGQNVEVSNIASIRNLSATVTKPADGASPVFSATAGDDSYTVTVNEWYNGGTADTPNIPNTMSASDTFIAGNPYVVEVIFTPKEGYLIRSDRSVTINGLDAFFCGSQSSTGAVYYRVGFTAKASADSGTEDNPYVVTDYAELRNLMATAPKDGSTRYIKLGADVVYGANSGENDNNSYIGLKADTQNVVLDLNGHTITNKANVTYSAVIYMTTGSLTIKDSSPGGTGGVYCEMTGNDKSAVHVSGSITKLTIDGGTYKSNVGSVIRVDGGAETVINGGTFRTTGEQHYCALFYSGPVTVNGGIFYGCYTEIGNLPVIFIGYDNADVNLYGCIAYGDTIYMGGSSISDGYVKYTDTINGEKAIVVSRADGSEKYPLVIDGNYYQSELLKWVREAPTDGTTRYIKLAADIKKTEGNGWCLDLKHPYQKVVLDLNGHTITSSGMSTDWGVVELSIGSLTIRDSAGGGAIIAGHSGPQYVNALHVSSAGHLTVDGGTFKASGNNGTAIFTQGGTTVINGGTFESEKGWVAWFDSGTVTLNGGYYIPGGDTAIYFHPAANVMLVSLTAEGKVTKGGENVDIRENLAEGSTTNSSIYQGQIVRDSSGLVVITGSPKISNVAITGVVAPVAGETPSNSVGSDTVLEHCSIDKYIGGEHVGENTVEWYDGNTMNPVDTFEAGKLYMVTIRLVADEGFSFSKKAAVYETLTVNGDDDAFVWKVLNNGKYAYIGYIFEAVAAGAAVKTVDISVDDHFTDYMPAGPDVTVSGSNFSSDLSGLWHTWNDKDLSNTNKSVAGMSYYKTITLTATGDYKFNVATAVNVTGGGKLNYNNISEDGKTMTVSVKATATEHEHDYGWTMKYNSSNHWYECTLCGEKKDFESHSLKYYSTGAGPAPGTTVTFTCHCGYSEDHTMPGTSVSEFYAVAVRPNVNMALIENSVYLKSWWAEVAEIVPGSIKWYKNDETTPLPVGYIFRSGESYKVTVQFQAKDGYSFNDSMTGDGSGAYYERGIDILNTYNYNTEVSADNRYVTATGYYSASSIGVAHTVSAALPTFTPGDKFSDAKYDYNSIFTVDGEASSIGTVSVVFDDATTMVKYDVSNGEWKAYTSSGGWIDYTGTKTLDELLTIQKGVEYEIYFRDQTSSGHFDSAKSLEVADPGNSLTREVHFLSGSSSAAAAKTIYFFDSDGQSGGVTVLGTATRFGSQTDDMTIQLIKSGASEAAYEAIVKGDAAGYSIADVAPGTYTMKVMKNNHVTREYTVTVGSEDVTQDVKIHLKGDINGDGRVTTIDFVRVNSHARGVTLLSGYELKCADVVGTDGKVTTADAIRINAHAKGTSLLW